jgi:hypothetical protein
LTSGENAVNNYWPEDGLLVLKQISQYNDLPLLILSDVIALPDNIERAG